MKSIPTLPKVLLHDHLDGGLRPGTVLELAAESGYEALPASDAGSLAAWFDQSGSGSLVSYLAAFAQTVGVMQTAAALQRVAHEAVEDLAADGVVYAELRFAPSLHRGNGLDRGQVVEAVLAGLRSGEKATGTRARLIVDAMRDQDDSLEVAETAAGFAGRGVVGFDLAGPEAGYPAMGHIAALDAARRGGLHVTVHAGEAAGPSSIADALDAGAERIGHGVKVIEDTVVRDGEIVELGPVARRVHEAGVPLELCPYSNLHTGAVPSVSEHPAGLLQRAGFAVTLNTDNRLMSRTTMSAEMALARDHLGFDDGDLRLATDIAVAASFCDEATRGEVAGRIAAAYAAL